MRKIILKYTIPLLPITKKNSQHIFRNAKTGRPFIGQSRQYKDYERSALWYLKPAPVAPISEPCNVKMLFYMPAKRRVDLVNLQESCLDILVLAGILKDDNAAVVASMDGSRVLYDKKDPRTEVEITTCEN